jgi:hypothetical protein
MKYIVLLIVAVPLALAVQWLTFTILDWIVDRRDYNSYRGLFKK